MVATYTPGASPRDAIRLYIPDTDLTDPLFQDAELDAIIALEGSQDFRYAVADCLEIVATDTARVQQVTKTLDLSTDGAAVAKVFLARAKTLREQANLAADAGAGFEIVEMVPNEFAARERLRDQVLRTLPAV